MANIIQRPDIAVYFQITQTVESVTTISFTRAGECWTSFTENPNAQTKTRKYISERTERQNITKYSPQWAFECLMDLTKPEIEMIYNIVKERRTGSQTLVTFVVVDIDPTSQATSFPARKVQGAVQISSIDDDDDMIIKGSIYNQGDEVAGTFDTETNTFTAAA